MNVDYKLHPQIADLQRHPVTITGETDLKFQIVDWYARDTGDELCKREMERAKIEAEEDADHEGAGGGDDRCNFRDPRKYEINMFGVTKEGYSVCCKAQDYKPFFYLKLPEDRPETVATSIYKLLCRKTYQHKFDFKDKGEKPHYHPWSSGLISMQLFDRYDLDAGFTNRKKFKFVEFTFSNYTTMRKCAKMIRDIQHPNTKYKNKGPPKRETNEEKAFKMNCMKVKLYESNIDPMLRFMHLRDIQATGWVVLKAGTYKVVSGDNKESRCQIETSVHWKKVEPDNEDNTVAPIRQASFDIECISHDRKFPKPEDLPNKVIQIATAIKDYGDKDFTRKHILALGPCNPIEGSVVEVCETEKELLIKWAQLLQKLDPDIIIGYNIFGFDLNYIMVRAEKLGCLDQFAFMAKLKNYKCFVQKKQLKSKAYGANYYLMVEMPGRFQLDLYPYIKKEMKLVSYKLGFVSETILNGETKHDILPKEISEGFESGDVERITRIAAYCVQDTLLPQLIIDKMNILISLIEMGKVTYVPLSYLINRGQQIKVFSNFAKTARQYGYILPHIFVENQDQDGEGVRRMKAEKIFNGDEDDEDEEEDEETYEGATVLDPQIGFYDEPIACLDFMSLYPTIEIDWNLDFASLVKDYFKYGKLNLPYNSVFIPVPPPDECPEPSVLWSKLTITLFEATNRIYLCFNNNVTEEERKEIMPEFTAKLAKFQGNRMESEAQYVSYVHRTHDHDFETIYSRDTSPQWSVPFTSNSMKWLYRTFPGAKTRKLYLWGQNFQGLLPKVLVNLLGARSKAKKQMEAEADPFMKSVYDQKQLALKVCCNSVYGFCGATATGMLPCKPVAECTTTIGRWQIEKSRDFSENIENFRQIMKYDVAFPNNYPYICRFFNSAKPVKEQEKFWIADIKKVLGMYKLTNTSDPVWDSIHAHFKENSTSKVDRAEYSQTYNLTLKSDPATTTFEIYTTDSFSVVDSVTLKHDIHSDNPNDIMYALNTQKGKIIPINYYDPQHKITVTHTDDKGYSANVKYGDSVTGDTPILCKFGNGKIGYRSIDNLTIDNSKLDWIPYGNDGKEQCILPIEAWTERGWTKINRIIRHKTDKDIFRVLTRSGCVDVTSDHSLLNSKAERVTPNEVRIGSKLLHANLPKNISVTYNIKKTDVVKLGENSVNKIIPDEILNERCAMKKNFMDAYFSKSCHFNLSSKDSIIDVTGKMEAATLFYMLEQVGYKCTINSVGSNDYEITCKYNTKRKGKHAPKSPNRSVVKGIEKLGQTSDYVYDLETENNHFSAGIGRMIVHNTDSIFTKFEAPQFPDLERKIAYNMICGSYVADRITDYLRSLNRFKDDSEKWTTLQFEKVYGLLLLFSKKRYAGTFYGCNPKKYSYIDKKGVALKRRDFCILVKEVYYDCLKILFNDELGTPKVRLDMAIAKARGAIDDLLNHRVPIEKLELSNLLNDEYKVREQKVKKNEKMHTFSENNVFMNDMVVIDHPQYGLVEGKVVAKRSFDQKNFFNRAEFKKPIDVYLKLEKENGKIEFEGKVSVEYIDIKAKSGFIITLKKILDPLTDERELALVSQSHVRLARKMFLRDPGSAPCSGERVPSVYVEIEDNGKEVLQWQKAEHPAYAKEHNMKLDVLYYLEHQLRKPIKQIFSLIMKDPDSLFDGLIKDYKNKQQKQNTIDSFFKPYDVVEVKTSRQTKRRNVIEKKRPNDEVDNNTNDTKKSKTESPSAQQVQQAPQQSAPQQSAPQQSASVKTQGKQLTGSNVKQTGLTGWLMSKK